MMGRLILCGAILVLRTFKTVIGSIPPRDDDHLHHWYCYEYQEFEEKKLSFPYLKFWIQKSTDYDPETTKNKERKVEISYDCDALKEGCKYRYTKICRSKENETCDMGFRYIEWKCDDAEFDHKKCPHVPDNLPTVFGENECEMRFKKTKGYEYLRESCVVDDESNAEFYMLTKCSIDDHVCGESNASDADYSEKYFECDNMPDPGRSAEFSN